MSNTVSGDTQTIGEAGVTGTFAGDPRVVDPRDFAAGVLGLAFGQPGVWGIACGGPGVLGQVQGAESIGVQGNSLIDPDTETAGTGVFGTGGTGVFGTSGNGKGFLGGIDPVFGQHAGVFGQSDQTGVFGNSD